MKKLILCTLTLLQYPSITITVGAGGAGGMGAEMIEKARREEAMKKERERLKKEASSLENNLIYALESDNILSLKQIVTNYYAKKFVSEGLMTHPWRYLHKANSPQALLLIMNNFTPKSVTLSDAIVDRIFEWSNIEPALLTRLLQVTNLEELYKKCTTTKTAHILIQNGASLMTPRSEKSTILHQLASEPETPYNLLESFAIIPHLNVIPVKENTELSPLFPYITLPYLSNLFARITLSYQSPEAISKKRVLATLFCLKNLLPKDMIMHILAQNPEDITNPKMLEALYPHMNERTIAQSCNLLPNAWFKKVLIPEYQKLIVATLTQQRLEYAKKLCDIKNKDGKLARELTTDPEKQLLLDPVNHDEYLKTPIRNQVIKELEYTINTNS